MHQRPERVGEAIKEEISDILRNEIKDPRIGFVSVVEVEVSPDLRHAKVYVSVLGDDEARVQSLKGLESATGFIRSEIGRRIRLRHTPEILFRLDKSIEHGVKIARLLNEIRPDGEGEGKGKA